MKKQDYKIEGYVYVPLAEFFDGKANEIGHQAHIQTFSRGNETYHVMAVNTQSVEGIGDALENDLKLIEDALKKTPDQESLKAQKVKVSQMCLDFNAPSMRHDIERSLCVATENTVQRVLKSHVKKVNPNDVVVISGLSHYDEI